MHIFLTAYYYVFFPFVNICNILLLLIKKKKDIRNDKYARKMYRHNKKKLIKNIIFFLNKIKNIYFN